MTEAAMVFVALPSINCLTARECQEQSCELGDLVQVAAGRLIFLDKHCSLRCLDNLGLALGRKVLEDKWSRNPAVQMDVAQDC
ncbi:unnamed protein product [Gongylonema pulchrum]|uniref:Secreted protein n=1 Tax=Gongylonema pulchrum TaxID=637853 RepID=A0A183ERH7_9BILA|nr:unnamed protein product [Gongylonema pulchrum]